MNSTLLDENVASDQTIVASYLRHADAENAVRALASDGIPMQRISIIGRHYETVQDVQGFFRPADGAVQGAGQGAWFGGLFGLMLGAFGFFVFPVIGGLFAIGPIAGLIAGAIGGAGIGALIEGLVVAGIPRDQAIKYQDRLQAGEFLVVVHGSSDQSMRAHESLQRTNQTDLQSHGSDRLGGTTRLTDLTTDMGKQKTTSIPVAQTVPGGTVTYGSSATNVADPALTPEI